jgi:hypothetical protein
VAVPEDIDKWLSVSPEELILRRSAYWVSLAGLPGSSNETSVTVNVPTNQLLKVEQLRLLMQKVSEEGAL